MTTSPSPLELRLFGPFDLRFQGQAVPLRNRKADRLLAYLVLRDRMVSSETVLEEVWGPQEQSTLRKAVGELRQHLGEQVVEMRNQTLRLALPVECDALRFDRGIASKEEMQRLDAVELYTGPLLVGWNAPEDGWVIRERERRKGVYLEAVHHLCQSAVARGDFPRVVHLARKAVSCHSDYQQGWYDLLYAQERLGELSQALQAAQHYHQQMRQSGFKPMPRIERLIQQLQSGNSQEKPPAPTSGPVAPEDSRYVVRPADHELRRSLYEGQWTVLIKGPHQTGKSSLLARGLEELRQSGHITIFTDFSTWAQEDISDAQRLCRRLAESLLLELQESRLLRDLWITELAPGAMLTEIVRQQLQRIAPARLIWAMDGLDGLFGTPYQEGFFSQLRHWHSQHALHPHPWSSLSLVLVCSREPHLFIRDMNQSPFNVSYPIATDDFTSEEAEKLHLLCGSPVANEEELEAIYELLGGHPSLLQRAYAALGQSRLSASQLLLEAPTSEGLFGSHLRRIGAMLEQSPPLQDAVFKALSSGACEERAFFELRSAGILRGRSSAQVQLRCPLYESFLVRIVQDR